MEQLMYVIIFIGFIYFVVKAIELFANNSVIDEVRKLPLEERKIALTPDLTKPPISRQKFSQTIQMEYSMWKHH